MRRYREAVTETRETAEIICNKCGRKIPVKQGTPVRDVLEVEKRWGYFSEKDGRRDRFDLCEACYDEFVKDFAVPVETED